MQFGENPPGSFTTSGKVCPEGYDKILLAKSGPYDSPSWETNLCVPKPVAIAPPAPAPAPVYVTVSPTITSTVSPQISPVFVQQDEPVDSPVTAGTVQTSGSAPAPAPDSVYDSGAASSTIPQYVPPAPVTAPYYPPAPASYYSTAPETIPQYVSASAPVDEAGISSMMLKYGVYFFGAGAALLLFTVLRKGR